MNDKSPNSLEPVKKIHVAKMSRWPLYAFLIIVLLLFGALVYSVNFAHNQDKDQAGTPKVDIREEEKPLIMGEGKGLALPPPNTPAIAQPEKAPAKPDPLIVVRDNKQEPDQYLRELENIRRMKAQAQLTALSAPLGVKTASTVALSSIQGEKKPEFEKGSGPDLYGLRESAYDPSADKDKEAFFTRAGRDESWILQHGRMAGQALEIKTGSVIPSVMVTGVNSDLPGNIIAQVSQNVWDTASGRKLLIPQGAKLFGVYGQERVLVAWNRIVFPDGSSFTLGAMPGSDMSGYAGYTDEINNHYLRIFGSAVLMSLISGGMAYTIDSLDSSSGQNSVPSMQQEMGSALAAQLGQATMQLLQKNLNIKPTLEIRPGYQFNVIVTKDLVFEAPYAAGK
ncbi:putative conjugal transfer protein TrbI [Deltaproteobacteria bacterium]|nr:putative conjugal transfer protein TrbI [Deltaproteobacteria bacterium]